MEMTEQNIKLWKVNDDSLVKALTDYISDWQWSGNSDLHEFLMSYTGYFSADVDTKLAIEIVLKYARQLMESDEKQLRKELVWQLPNNEMARFLHITNRKITEQLSKISDTKLISTP